MELQVGKKYTNRHGLAVLILAALANAAGGVRAYAVQATNAESGDFFYEVDADGKFASNPSYDIVDENERKFEMGKFYESESGKWIGTALVLNAKVPGHVGECNVFALYNVERESATPDIRVFQNNRSVVGSVVLYRGRETPQPGWLA